MSKHTQGPWYADVGDTAVVRDSQGNQLAMFTHLHTRTGGRRDAGEVAANARIAAEAPELLAVLLEIVSEFARDGHGGEFEDGEHPMVDRARALIARCSAHQKTDGAV